ncbi:unnamed protein product [Closterium sp. Naga37s-1]|nr:unnamed protein product [Closterium sp. Naga37s-1]CAI5492656.1 unnamed protein product [Closterium sp. Naga37s-1]
MADYSAGYPTFYEAPASFRNRIALMQSVLQVPTSTPLHLAAEEEDTWNHASWDSSSAAEESYEAPEGSSVTAETSYEAADYYSEASQDHSAGAEDISEETSCEAVTYALEASPEVSGASEGLTETAEAPLEAAEDSSSSCSDGGVSKKESISKIGICSGDNHSSSFGFTMAWAQVTKEVLSGVFNALKNGRNCGTKKSAETAAVVGGAVVGGAVGPAASTARSIAGKGSASRMAADRLRELPSRIPKPSKGSAGGAVKHGTRPAAASACLPPSLIPKPRSAKTAPAAVAGSGTAETAVVVGGNTGHSRGACAEYVQ